MNVKTIFCPVIALVLFTVLIGLRVLQTRVSTLRRKRVPAQALADGRKWDELLGEVENPSDAFENLFEIPVLFYTIVLAVFVTQQVDGLYVWCAWTFVFFRVIQGWIHCSYNEVMHRAMAFWLGCFVLIAMWARFGWQIMAGN